MKHKLMQKLFWLLTDWLRSRFARRLSGKVKFSEMRRRKKLSFKHKHLLKVSKLLKNRFRQTVWTRS